MATARLGGIIATFLLFLASAPTVGAFGWGTVHRAYGHRGRRLLGAQLGSWSHLHRNRIATSRKRDLGRIWLDRGRGLETSDLGRGVQTSTTHFAEPTTGANFTLPDGQSSGTEAEGGAQPVGMRTLVAQQANVMVAEGEGLSPGALEGLSAVAPSDEAPRRQGVVVQQQNFLKTLWEFSRPHTMIGTALAIPSIGAFAAPAGLFPWRQYALAMLWALVPSLLINVYITGLNQITDVEIDRINKPYLPIPAGHLTMRSAVTIVTLCLAAGMGLGIVPSLLGSRGLQFTVVVSTLIGTCYSLPPFRLKRFPQLAATCILAVRGSVINAGFYAHAMAAAFGKVGTSSWSALLLPVKDVKCSLVLGYFTIFAIIIALMKDVPDVAGDRLFNIPSFSVVLGEAGVFRLARRLLTLLLCGAGGTLALGSRAAAMGGRPGIALTRILVGLSAGCAAQLVRRRSLGVDLENPKQIYGYYMFLWKIFYASYLLLPFAR